MLLSSTDFIDRFLAGTLNCQCVGIAPGARGYKRIRRVISVPEYDDWVLVRVLACGLCPTDQGLETGAYGAAALGQKNIVTGHEGFVLVEHASRGATDRGIEIGGRYICTVRSPLSPPAFPNMGTYPPVDLWTDGYFERGLSGQDGFLCEYAVVRASELIAVQNTLHPVLGVLAEPASCILKAIRRALESLLGRAGLNVGSGAKILVAGAAGLCGFLAVAAALDQGYEVIGVDVQPETSPGVKLIRAIGLGRLLYFQDDLKTFAVRDQVRKNCGPILLAIDTTGDMITMLKWSPLVAAYSCFGIPTTVRSLADHVKGLSEEILAGLSLDSVLLGMVLGNRSICGSVNANTELDFPKAVELVTKLDNQCRGLLMPRINVVSTLTPAAVSAGLHRRPDERTKSVVLPGGEGPILKLGFHL